jgi:hypothetical protein
MTTNEQRQKQIPYISPRDDKTTAEADRCAGRLMGRLVAGERGVDGAGPGVDASGEGLDIFEALIAEPHGDAERTCSVVAEDDYLLIWIEFRMGAGGDLAHGHEQRVGEGGGLVLPGFAHV